MEGSGKAANDIIENSKNTFKINKTTSQPIHHLIVPLLSWLGKKLV
jgi:hypothetical protein